jgi:translocator protein
VTWLASYWGSVLVASVAAATVAILGGIATPIGPWYRKLRKPSWQPPDWLFGPAWTVIFGTIAAAGVFAWWGATDRARTWLVILLFALNAALNVLWSVLFFTFRRPDWALIEVVALWLSILALVLAFKSFAPAASLLLLPYLAWVAFAAILNRAVVRLNAPFGAP